MFGTQMCDTQMFGTLAKTLKLATIVESLATGLRIAMLLCFDSLAGVEVVPFELCPLQSDECCVEVVPLQFC